MSIIYTGYGKDQFHEQPGAVWSRTPEDLDLFDVIMGGIKTRKDDYIATLIRGAQHPFFPSMYLIDWSEDDGRAFSYVNLRYIGLKNSSRGIEKSISRRVAIKTASNSTDSPEKATRDLTYKSPEIIYTYATNKEILNSQHLPPSSIPGFSLDVLRDTITAEDGTIYHRSAPAGLATALSLSPFWTVASIESSRITHTPFWSNQEVWAYEYP